MKRYESYKDSGIEGIGEIPSHWETKNLQALAKNEKYSFTGGPFGSDLKFDDYTVEGVRIIQLQNIGDGTFNDDYKIYTSNEKADSLSSCNIFPGEIIIAKMADPVARACIIPNTESRFVMASDGIRLVVNDNVSNSQFATYSINSNYFRSQAELNSSGSTRLRIGLNTLKKLKFVFPPLNEQIIISSFLEKRTSELDKLIADKQKLLELLNEERTAMINQAVTKGLDTNFPMKDSSVEWLGEIPESWTIGKLKFFCELITDGSHFSPPSLESGKRYISVKDVKENTIDFENCKYISDDDFLILERNGCRPKENDILLTKDGTIGRASIVQEDNDFVILSSLAIIRAKLKFINPSYLKHFLVSKINVEQMLSSLQGSALTRITLSIINNLYIIVPPINEQEKILDHIKEHSDTNEKLVLKVQQEIELLKEYKIALISEVVTGKVDVQHEVIADCVTESAETLINI
ncbi:restriction endonuclease subunit S [Pedobacter sp. MC2016-24]|uniref:restriction endonuclease subunit S n=1 Tax=Pedobacter sp. MC2016-24 TaxID=2780090 RepID=UPI00187DF13C|nr:restriction endonuclease subunit S [Pedobacter sp. MC2016-24]MBE9603127.1 restriction endonuclease subunit S [Pedobacter sp. MC2016-24]